MEAYFNKLSTDTLPVFFFCFVFFKLTSKTIFASAQTNLCLNIGINGIMANSTVVFNKCLNSQICVLLP